MVVSPCFVVEQASCSMGKMYVSRSPEQPNKKGPLILTTIQVPFSVQRQATHFSLASFLPVVHEICTSRCRLRQTPESLLAQISEGVASHSFEPFSRSSLFARHWLSGERDWKE